MSPSYQMSYASTPFAAPGKLGGETFRKQFHTAITARPDNIMISSYNEFIAQPIPLRLCVFDGHALGHVRSRVSVG